MRLPLNLWILVMFTGAAVAQSPVPQPPPADSSSHVTVGFDRSRETYSWSERLRYDRSLDVFDVRLDQLLRSRLIRTGRDAIQDELGVRLNLGRPVASGLEIRASAVSTVLRDNTQLDLGSLERHQVLVGPSVHIRPGMMLGANLGYEVALQQGVRDGGAAGGLRFQGDLLRIDEFDVSALASAERAWTDPRTSMADSASIRIARSFSEAASNTVSFAYARQQREFHVPADPGVRQDFQIATNIFRRTTNDVGVTDTLVYEAGSSAFRLHAALFHRTIERSYRFKSISDPSAVILDGKIVDDRFVGGGTFRFAFPGSFEANITAEFEEREERHSVQDDPMVPRPSFDRQNLAARRLSSTARRTTIATSSALRISEKDMLNLSGSASILRYDTPDSLNTDDRDELLLLFAVEEIHRFSDHLSLSILADAALSHLVYLSRFQSANNAWNRIIRFRPSVTYRPAEWFATRASAEVMANYTVFDFEEQVQTVRSYSFRQATWTDSTWIRISNSLQVLFQGSLKIYERGILRWQEFRERPERYFVEQSYWPQISVGVAHHLTMTVGFRYFSQARYVYKAQGREFEGRLVSAGPTVAVSWMGPAGSRVSLEGWREQQSDQKGPLRAYSNLSCIVGILL